MNVIGFIKKYFKITAKKFFETMCTGRPSPSYVDLAYERLIMEVKNLG